MGYFIVKFVTAQTVLGLGTVFIRCIPFSTQ